MSSTLPLFPKHEAELANQAEQARALRKRQKNERRKKISENRVWA